MNKDERNEHFQGYANLLFLEVSKLFFTLYARIEEHRPIEEIDAVEDEIRTLIAQRAFDLAQHTLLTVPIISFEKNAEGAVFDVPDLTQWHEYGETE